MSKDPDTARRERALATMDEIPPDADMDWADAQETRSDYGLGFLVGYLAGSREEAEIRSEEVERLESVARGLKQCCEEYRAEIAALREAVRWVDGKVVGHRIIRAEPGTWHNGWDEWRERPVVSRALKEKP